MPMNFLLRLALRPRAAVPRLDRRRLGLGVLTTLLVGGARAEEGAVQPRRRPPAEPAGEPPPATLTLTAEPGGPPSRGRLPVAATPVRLTMRPRARPLLGTAGTTTRCGLDGAAADVVVLHVTNLDGGDGVGTLRWAVRTDTDHAGHRFHGPAVVVFDVSGHINLRGPLIFDRPHRWIAGQTAPRAADGSGGVYVHGWMDRKVRRSDIVVEHLRFVDGHPTKADLGALDVGYNKDEDIGHVLIRNCSFLWGTDETFTITPAVWRDRRVDNCTVVDCIFAEPAQIDGRLGYNVYLQRGAHRTEFARNFLAGSRARSPGMNVNTSTALINNFAYDTAGPPGRIFARDWRDRRPAVHPVGQTLTLVGNVNRNGPSFGAGNTTTYFVQHYGIDPEQPLNGVRRYYADERVDGEPSHYEPNKSGHTILAEPPLWPVRPILPHGDVEPHVHAHAGAWPGDRSATEARIMAAWRDGEGLAHHATDYGALADFPDARIAATIGRPPDVPTAPFRTEANGLTRIENWLEELHVAVGGAPWQDFGRRLRFPWGGILTVDGAGTVTFEPEEMTPLDGGELIVDHAGGARSRVRVTVR